MFKTQAMRSALSVTADRTLLNPEAQAGLMIGAGLTAIAESINNLAEALIALGDIAKRADKETQ